VAATGLLPLPVLPVQAAIRGAPAVILPEAVPEALEDIVAEAPVADIAAAEAAPAAVAVAEAAEAAGDNPSPLLQTRLLLPLI